jgi:hypothetical protein
VAWSLIVIIIRASQHSLKFNIYSQRNSMCLSRGSLNITADTLGDVSIRRTRQGSCEAMFIHGFEGMGHADVVFFIFCSELVITAEYTTVISEHIIQ